MRVNFKGIYSISIPRANKEEMIDIKQMAQLGNAEVVISSPFAEDTAEMVESSPVMQNLSLGWLKKNFEKNGATLPRCFNDTVDVFLITGQDAEEYRKTFNLKKLKQPEKLVEAIRRFVNKNPIEYGADSVTKTMGYLRFIGSQERQFDEFVASKNVRPMLDALNE